MTETVVDARAPERAVVVDMARLSLFLGPGFVAIGALFWRLDGLLSSVLAFALVLMNLALGAMIVERAAAISLSALMGAVLGGFAARFLLLTLVVVPIRHAGWFEVVPFAIALIGGHLGLLTWEAQRVSAALAAPPGRRRSSASPQVDGLRSPSTSLRTRSESE